ncbi:amidohydrolase [Rhodococcus daqingensis]|uniref:Amidohydrolase n=1 Tax=Rhodococcus daqingensis TaxID=2479363 RepID=A0ABW2RYP0_9NOCA
MIGLGRDHRGEANYTAGQLSAIVDAYFPLGWQMACHVLGDVGVDSILDVYEAALTEHPRADHRLRLEHCGAMTAAQFQRAARLGVTCSLLIDHLDYWGDVLVDGLFGEEIGSHWMRARSAIDAGVRISLHNDSPVTPVEPLRNISVAATRTSRTGRVLAPEERVTVDEALRAQTIWAAHQLFADDIIGTLTPGKYADLVLLSADPRAVDPAAIADLTVEATYLAGRATHRASG